MMSPGSPPAPLPSSPWEETSSPAGLNVRRPLPPGTKTICQLLHSLNVGGAEVLAERLGRQLGGRYRFVFACLDGLGPLGERLRDAGYPVCLLERQPGWDLACARRLRDWVREEQVDLIHAHQYTPFSYALLSGLFRSRPPVLFTEHGRWFPDERRLKRVLFNRAFLRRTDRVIAVGEFVRQALIRNEGLPAARVRVIYNGVDLARYATPPGAEQAVAVRRELGLPANALVLIQVARLDALKDHLTALRTLKSVLAQQPDAHLLLVGGGPEQAAIEQESRRLGLTERVHLLGLRSDVARLLSAADVFLLTSVSEGIPLTLIEAMAARVPIVSTNVGGIAEVVLDGQTGLLAPAKDEQALAAAVLRLCDPQQATWREQLVQAAAERAKLLFSEAANHAAYCELFDDMLNAGAQR